MFKAQFDRQIRYIILIAAIGGALLTGGCDQLFVSDDAESQFLERRVDQLEERVRQLEGQIVALRGGGAPARSSAAAPAIPGLPPAPGLPAAPATASNSAAASLQSDEDRANILLLKAKQLEAVPRAKLPGKFTELGIGAPEIDQIQSEIRLAEAERARITGDGNADEAATKEVDSKLDKLRYRLELTAEAVRQRVIEASEEASARLQPAAPKPADGAPGGAGAR